MASRLLSAAERASNKSFARSTYRDLIRATYLAFQNDTPTLLASRKYAHDSFAQCAAYEPGSVEAGQALEHAQGVTKILRENVVQGKRVGNEGERYKLRMHEHTQRMDNATAGELKGTTKSFKEIKGERF